MAGSVKANLGGWGCADELFNDKALQAGTGQRMAQDAIQAAREPTAPAAATFHVLRNFDTRVLPVATGIYIGFGLDLQDMVGNGQFQRVGSF